MANTLKFGNGEWYGKKDTILAYNDLNSNYKPLPFNFSRASKATVINKDGLIEEVGSGQPRVDYLNNTKGALKLEPSRTNLITYSSDFRRTYWTKSGATIQGDPSTAGSELVTNGDFATDSDWSKGTGWTISGGSLNGSSTTASAFQLNTGLVSGKLYEVVYTISNYVSGYVRIELGSGNVSVGTSRNANGTYTEYIEALGDEQLIFDGIVSFTGSIDNVSVKEVQGFTSPDGTNNAYKLVEGTNNGNHIIYKNNVNTGSGKSTLSLKAKAAERNWIFLYDTEQNEGCYFDLQNGVAGSTVGSPDSYSITSLQNGWYDITLTTTSTTRIDFQVHLAEANNDNTYQGNGTSGIYIAFAQAEFGSYATSYIATSGSSVTRLADSSSQTPPSGIIGQTEGTVFFDVNISHIVGNEALGGINSGGYANHVTIQRVGNTIQFVRNSATQSGATIVTSSAITVGRYRLALAYKSGDTACFLNGTQVSTTQTQTFTNATLNLIRISGDAIGALPISDTYNQAQLYNTRLSNSELAALTQV